MSAISSIPLPSDLFDIVLIYSSASDDINVRSTYQYKMDPELSNLYKIYQKLVEKKLINRRCEIEDLVSNKSNHFEQDLMRLKDLLSSYFRVNFLDRMKTYQYYHRDRPHLDLSGCELTDLPECLADVLDEIHSLDLSGNKFTHVPSVLTKAVHRAQGDLFSRRSKTLETLSHLLFLGMNGSYSRIKMDSDVEGESELRNSLASRCFLITHRSDEDRYELIKVTETICSVVLFPLILVAWIGILLGVLVFLIGP